MIKFDWEELKNPEEMAIIKKYATKSKNYTIVLTGKKKSFLTIIVRLFHVVDIDKNYDEFLSAIFIGFLFIMVITYFLPHLLNILVPLNQSRKSKSFPIETFFQVEDSIYGSVFIIFFIAYLGVIALAVYGCFLLFIQHACGMLCLTGYD